MDYCTLGRTNVAVSEISPGGWTMGGLDRVDSHNGDCLDPPAEFNEQPTRFRLWFLAESKRS